MLLSHVNSKPFCDQFQASKIQFGRTNLLYIYYNQDLKCLHVPTKYNNSGIQNLVHEGVAKINYSLSIIQIQ